MLTITLTALPTNSLTVTLLVSVTSISRTIFQNQTQTKPVIEKLTTAKTILLMTSSSMTQPMTTNSSHPGFQNRHY